MSWQREMLGAGFDWKSMIPGGGGGMPQMPGGGAMPAVPGGGAPPQPGKAPQQPKKPRKAPSLPKTPSMTVTTEPSGRWVPASRWSSSVLKGIWGEGQRNPVADPSRHAAAVNSMVSALSLANKRLRSTRSTLNRYGTPQLREAYKRLGQRWYEAASGLLRGAVYAGGRRAGREVTSLGGNLTVRGIRFAPTAVAFAVRGGSNYAAQLAKDAKELTNAVRALKPPPTEEQRAYKEGRGPRPGRSSLPVRSEGKKDNTLVIAGGLGLLGLLGLAVVKGRS